jgi:hypothetical protein
MRTSLKTKNKRKADERGAAYVLAVTSLLVGVILALAMIRAAGSYFIAEDTRQKKQAAINLAEAGIEYAFWQIHYNGARVPYSATVNLGDGSFQVSANDDGNRDLSTLIITSTGTVGGYKRTIKRVTLGLLPYHYAFCENKNADDGDALYSNGTGRGFRANGRINFGHNLCNITTGGWATTTITCPGTLTPRYPNSPPIIFPSVNPVYYSSIADYTYTGDVVFTSLNIPNTPVVIVVYGDVWIRGTYTGVYTIYCSHDIIVNGNLTPTNSTSYLALIANHKIRIENAASSVEAVLYSHTLGKTGLIEVKGATTITGSAAADDITTDSPTTFRPSSSLNLYVFKQLRLPGV